LPPSPERQLAGFFFFFQEIDGDNTFANIDADLPSLPYRTLSPPICRNKVSSLSIEIYASSTFMYLVAGEAEFRRSGLESNRIWEVL
jgi:hypothetical protein